jgi:hypothetical protein
MVTILGFSIDLISICAFRRTPARPHPERIPLWKRNHVVGRALEGGKAKAKTEKVEAATRTSFSLLRTSRAPTRAPRSTPHCVHPSNEHPRTVKDRFEPFPRRAGGSWEVSDHPPLHGARDPDRGAGTVRGFVLRSNSIKFKRRTQMRETRVLKTTDVSRSVPVAVSRPQPG